MIDSLRIANWKPAIPVAAAALLVAAGFMMDHPGSLANRPAGAPGAASVVNVSATEADQVEQTLDDIQLLHQFEAAADDAAAKQM